MSRFHKILPLLAAGVLLSLGAAPATLRAQQGDPPVDLAALPACSSPPTVGGSARPIVAYIALDESLTASVHDPSENSDGKSVPIRRYELVRVILSYLYADAEIRGTTNYAGLYRFPGSSYTALEEIGALKGPGDDYPLAVTTELLAKPSSEFTYPGDSRRLESLPETIEVLAEQVRAGERQFPDAQPLVIVITDGTPLAPGESTVELKAKLASSAEAWLGATDELKREAPLYVVLLEFVPSKGAMSSQEARDAWGESFYGRLLNERSAAGNAILVGSDLVAARHDLLEGLDEVVRQLVPVSGHQEVESVGNSDSIIVGGGLVQLKLFTLASDEADVFSLIDPKEGDGYRLQPIEGAPLLGRWVRVNAGGGLPEDITAPLSGVWTLQRTAPFNWQAVDFIDQVRRQIKLQVSPPVVLVGQGVEVRTRLDPSPKADEMPTFQADIAGPGSEVVDTVTEFDLVEGALSGRSKPLLQPGDYGLTVSARRGGEDEVLSYACRFQVAPVPDLTGQVSGLLGESSADKRWDVTLTISGVNAITAFNTFEVSLVGAAGDRTDARPLMQAPLPQDPSQGGTEDWTTTIAVPAVPANDGAHVEARLKAATTTETVVVSDEWWSSNFNLPVCSMALRPVKWVPPGIASCLFPILFVINVLGAPLVLSKLAVDREWNYPPLLAAIPVFNLALLMILFAREYPSLSEGLDLLVNIGTLTFMVVGALLALAGVRRGRKDEPKQTAGSGGRQIPIPATGQEHATMAEASKPQVTSAASNSLKDYVLTNLAWFLIVFTTTVWAGYIHCDLNAVLQRLFGA